MKQNRRGGLNEEQSLKRKKKALRKSSKIYKFCYDELPGKTHHLTRQSH